jgi:UDP-N-acetylmuramate--alanine ligase
LRELKKLNNSMKAHLIGIGGIGVSAIARMLLLDGYEVTGSDVATSLVTKELQKLGVRIYIGHNIRNLSADVELVIYTPAISKDNVELLEAKRLGITTHSYPEMLGKISADKYTIAIAGSHGKTTTTAMLGAILSGAGKAPTIIVGSLLKDKKSNFVGGSGEYLVVEACEYKRSFLDINPKIVVITNIDNDHLDYYGDIKGVISGFSDFVKKIPKDGYLVCDPKASHLKAVIRQAKCEVIDYTKAPRNFKLKILGDYNIKNAQAAWAAAKLLSVTAVKAKKALESYGGTWRRFEYKGRTKNGIKIYDDYAHHPTEIKAALKSARKTFGKKRIICVFQPHLFSRTKFLLKDFGKSFSDADVVVVFMPLERKKM